MVYGESIVIYLMQHNILVLEISEENTENIHTSV